MRHLHRGSIVLQVLDHLNALPTACAGVPEDLRTTTKAGQRLLLLEPSGETTEHLMGGQVGEELDCHIPAPHIPAKTLASIHTVSNEYSQ